MSVELEERPVEALDLQSQSEQRQQFELEKQNEWKADQAKFYNGDSLAILSVAESTGIQLSRTIDRTLLGEGQPEDRGTKGIARASIEIGEIINGRKKPSDLFAYDSLKEREIITRDDDGYEYADWIIDLPDEQKLEDLSTTTLAGESGQLLFQLLKDSCYPYQPTKGDGYIVVESRKAVDAYKTGKYDFAEGNIAKLCSNTEYHFTKSLQGDGSLDSINVDGVEVALKKHDGDHTAITTKPIVLNGVRIPVGSVVIAEGDDESGYKFGFGRLTAFCFDQTSKAERQFSDIFRREYLENIGFDRALDEFNKKAGREQSSVESLLDRYYQEYSGDWQKIAAAIHNDIDNKLDGVIERHITNGLETTQTKSMEASALAFEDRSAYKESDHTIDPNNRSKIIKQIAVLKSSMYRVYGIARVNEVAELLSIKEKTAKKL